MSKPIIAADLRQGSEISQTATQSAVVLRWIAISVFVLSNILNFLDRLLLASLAPTIKTEFVLSNAEYGLLVSAFSLVYAVAAPFAGLFLDRVGLKVGVTAAVSLWSCAGIATGLVSSFRGLFISRAALGLGEAAGLPFLSKANATYLPASEWALASAAGSISVTIGTMLAPLLVAWMAPIYGWRSVFMVSGSLGFLWVALWLFTARRIPPQTTHGSQFPVIPARDVLRDRRLWHLALAYALVLMVLILWLNWTTVYLVREHSLTQNEANRYFAWIPPIFAPLGGFFNGWLVFRWIRRGTAPIAARNRVALLCLPLFFVTAAVPWMPSAAFAVAAVGLGVFACQAVVGSLNILPIDLFGPGRAAFSISVMACAYSLMQTLVSPLIGLSIDHFGFSAVCWAVALLPIIGIWVMRRAFAS